MELKLYSRYRNPAGQRVRTALNIKGGAHTSIFPSRSTAGRRTTMCAILIRKR